MTTATETATPEMLAYWTPDTQVCLVGKAWMMRFCPYCQRTTFTDPGVNVRVKCVSHIRLFWCRAHRGYFVAPGPEVNV